MGGVMRKRTLLQSTPFALSAAELVEAAYRRAEGHDASIRAFDFAQSLLSTNGMGLLGGGPEHRLVWGTSHGPLTNEGKSHASQNRSS